MSDRELLELAAKAAGHRPWGADCEGYPIFVVGGLPMGWNPLTDDGDALRLAVRLRMTIVHWYNAVDVDQVEQEWSGNPEADVRRAIVRAAAEIGQAKP
jgi:hypothetical protein